MKTKSPAYTAFTSLDKDTYQDVILSVFAYQYTHIPVYRAFADALKRTPETVKHWQEIPFMPVEFFKYHKVLATDHTHQQVFKSSGTTASTRAQHYIHSLKVYEQSFLNAFRYFYGHPKDFIILALLPSYIENGDSSLVYMTEGLIRAGADPRSGFFLHDYKSLYNTLETLQTTDKKVLLLGVSYALLDFVNAYPISFPELIVMETGGMKGRHKELLREELHQILKEGFDVPAIHSEYGMTELLSQAYSKGNGRFSSPPWMQIHIRDTKDPFHLLPQGKAGAINIIDLANYYSVSFLATQDIGIQHADSSFEVQGRFDHSDIRGCNLLIMD